MKADDRASGDGSGLTPAQFSALAHLSDTMPAPVPGEWLDQMKEPGQTFKQFVGACWNKPHKQRNTIYLQPLDRFLGTTSPDITLLKMFTESYFMMPVDILPVVTIDAAAITSRINTGTHKKQLLTADILDYLQKHLPSDAFCIAAITMQDLYPQPSWNFVFGEASLVNRVGVFSFARYDPAFYQKQDKTDSAEVKKLVLKRSCKVLGHEIGHMFGLYHCIYYRCEMNGSNHLQESDSRPLHLCPVCLTKLHYSIGFDIAQRYKKLQSFYQAVGFKPEADDMKRQVEVFSQADRK